MSASTENETSNDQLQPITPGEILNEDFLKPLGLTKYRVAKDTGVPPQRIGDIVAGKRSITADTDLRLSRYFGLTKGYWLRAQVAFDLEVTERQIREQIERIQPHQVPANHAERGQN